MGSDMTDRPSPFSVLSEMAVQFRQNARGLPLQEEIKTYWTGVGFTLGGIRFVAAMDEVSEVLTVPHYTRLPGVKPWVSGVANVRGRLVPIVELSAFFGLNVRPDSRERRILVVEYDDMLNGIVVDSVEGLQSFPVDEYQSGIPENITPQMTQYVEGHYSSDGVKMSIFGVHELVSSDSFMAVAS